MNRTPVAWPTTITGVIAAPLTPFGPDGSLMAEGIPPLVEFLIGGGIAGLMVGGTTGEFIAMDLPEREEVLSRFVEAVDGRVPVIAHIGHVDRRAALRLADHALATGADGTTAIAPYYHGVSSGAIAAYYELLASRTPDLPFFIYDFPGASGNPVPFDIVAPLLERVPNVVGAKLSVGSFDQVEPYLTLLPDFCVLVGNDSLASQAVASGNNAIVSGIAGVWPEIMSSLMAALVSGEPGATRSALAMADVAIGLGAGGSPDRLKRVLAQRALGPSVGPARVETMVEPELPPDVVQQVRRLEAALVDATTLTAP